jgi:hypothetical protein
MFQRTRKPGEAGLDQEGLAGSDELKDAAAKAREALAAADAREQQRRAEAREAKAKAAREARAATKPRERERIWSRCSC